jgi:hypothetical protein
VQADPLAAVGDRRHHVERRQRGHTRVAEPCGGAREAELVRRDLDGRLVGRQIERRGLADAERGRHLREALVVEVLDREPTEDHVEAASERVLEAGARVVRAAAGLDVRRDELALAPLEADGVAEVDLLALEQRRGRDDLEQARSGVLGLATHVPFLAARRPREDAPRLDVAHQHRAARRLGGVEQLVDRLLKGRVDGEADLGVIRARRLRAGALQLDGLELHRRLVAVFLGERVRRRHGERGDEGEGDGCSAHQPPM